MRLLAVHRAAVVSQSFYKQLCLKSRHSSIFCSSYIAGTPCTKCRGYSSFANSNDKNDNDDPETTSTFTLPTPQLPSQARVVICGGGVIGLSVAYHLAEKGWTDVVVLEQGK